MVGGTGAQHLSFGSLFCSSAAAASIGEIVSIPIDTAKVRLQLQHSGGKYHGTFSTMRAVAKEEGLASLWKGLVPGLHRQVVMGGLRIATYDPIKTVFANVAGEDPDHTSIPTKIVAAVAAGALGVVVGNPTDTLKVRMQSEGKLPPGAPRKYPSAMAAYGQIARAEGIKTLWSGVQPNIARTALINACELATYDQIKYTLIKTGVFEDSVPCHIAASLCAGFMAVVIGSPADVLKSRMMASAEYKNLGDAFIKTLRQDGPMAFYNGFGANFIRLGLWNVSMFISLEQIRRLMGAPPVKH